MPERKVVFGATLTIVFAAAGAFHAAAIVFPNVAPSASPLRHGVFAVINAGVAAGLAAGPARGRSFSRGVHAIFTSLFALLCLQQLWSHGADAWRAWTVDHRVDVASLGVLVVMPLTLMFLLRQGSR